MTKEQAPFTASVIAEHLETISQLEQEALYAEDATEREALQFATKELEYSLGNLLCLRFSSQMRYSDWNRFNALRKWQACLENQNIF